MFVKSFVDAVFVRNGRGSGSEAGLVCRRTARVIRRRRVNDMARLLLSWRPAGERGERKAAHARR